MERHAQLFAKHAVYGRTLCKHSRADGRPNTSAEARSLWMDIMKRSVMKWKVGRDVQMLKTRSLWTDIVQA